MLAVIGHHQVMVSVLEHPAILRGIKHRQLAQGDLQLQATLFAALQLHPLEGHQRARWALHQQPWRFEIHLHNRGRPHRTGVVQRQRQL